jgi:Amt family ammonium transporter
VDAHRDRAGAADDAGLSFFYGGMVRTKNVVSTMLQSFVAMGVISILWIVVGFSLAFGDQLPRVIGDPRTFFMFTRVGALTHPDLAPTIPLILFALFQLKFAIITPALITGSFAERVRFTAICSHVPVQRIRLCAAGALDWHPTAFLQNSGSSISLAHGRHMSRCSRPGRRDHARAAARTHAAAKRTRRRTSRS